MYANTNHIAIVTYIVSISQAFYTQYCPGCHTKCLPVSITFQIAEHNDHQIYHVFGMAKLTCSLLAFHCVTTLEAKQNVLYNFENILFRFIILM